MEGITLGFMESELKQRGFDCVYSTCERGMKAFYSLMGFEIREKLRTESGIQYLTRFVL